jgi:hypothetical protein
MSTFKGVRAEFNRYRKIFPVAKRRGLGSRIEFSKGTTGDYVTSIKVEIGQSEMTDKSHGARLFAEWLCELYGDGVKYNSDLSDRVVGRITYMLMRVGGE